MAAARKEVPRKFSIVQKSPNPPTPEREGLSPRLRFEVFKRDSFACQYCGRKAPEVVLHADHILPVSKGGRTVIHNLTTSCKDCNFGKSNRLLSDVSLTQLTAKAIDDAHSKASANRDSMIKLKELDAFEAECSDYAMDVWRTRRNKTYPPYEARKHLAKWIREFTLCEVITAIDITISQYLETDNKAYQKSDHNAFFIIPGICNKRAEGRTSLPPKLLAEVNCLRVKDILAIRN